MSKNLLFGIGILILSILNLIFKIINHLDLSIVISLVGIISFILQVQGLSLSKILQLIWIMAQIPLIVVSKDIGSKINETAILDLSQLYGFSIKFGLQYSSIWYSIGINAIAIIYLIIFKLIVRKEYLNQLVMVILNNEKSKISEYSPFRAEIIEYKKDWFTARLDKQIDIDGSELDLIRFKLRKGGFFKPNKERQFCEIKLASSVHGFEIHESGFVK